MMQALRILICLPFLAHCAQVSVAQLMEEYLWEKRVILVFAPTAMDARLAQQNMIFEGAASEMAEREIVVWQFIDRETVMVEGERKAHLSTNRFYEYFDVPLEQFTVILLGKDGEEKLRSEAPAHTTQLFELIDAMPMRQREMNHEQ